MTTLTPQAISAAPLLKAIAYTEFKSNSDLARSAGRQPSNMTRDLASLESAGWISRDPVALTDAGREILRAVERMEGGGTDAVTVVRAASGIVELLHAQIKPSDRNPRRDWDSADAQEALAELAASIKAEGRILQNLVVRPAGPIQDFNVEGPEGLLPLYELVAGERRWRAVRLLMEAGELPWDWRVPALIADLDDAGHDRVALIENLKRRDLKPLEEARAFKRLVEGGMKTAELAETINCTQRLVQQRLQLLELSDADQKRLESGKITIEQARNILGNRRVWPELPPLDLLALAEIAEKVRVCPKHNDSGSAEIDPHVDTSPFKDWISYPHYLFDFTHQHYDDGRSYARLSYYAKDFLRHHKLPCGADDEWVRAFNAFRAEVLGEKEAQTLTDASRFHTAWLNGPWDVTPEAQAELDVRAERVKQQRALDRAKQQESADRQQRLSDLLAAAEAKHQSAEGTDKGETLQQVMVAAESPLPWYFHQEGFTPAEILDANGEEVMSGTSYKQYATAPAEHARLRLIVMLANEAAGLETPTEKPVHVSERVAEDRPTFVSWIAERLQELLPDWNEEHCRSKAGHALDDSLKSDEIEFGADGYTWTVADAHDIAEGFAATQIERSQLSDDDDGFDDDPEDDEDLEDDADAEFEEA